MQPRWLGHTHTHYSVAEHSLRVSYAVDGRAALHALLHDASEAYFADLPSPLKALLPQYRELEKKAMSTIYAAFDIDPNIWATSVKQADLEICAAEARDLMPVGPYGLDSIKAHPDTIVPLPAEVAEAMFLNRFSQLRREGMEEYIGD